MACISPFYKQVNGSWLPLSCGRCPPCKKRRIDGWVFRMLQEEKRSLTARFITLTYDTRHVPISGNGFMTLDKRAFPLYMKRLRKIVSNVYGMDNGNQIPPVKYYACGEYGTENKRPHYHAIVFGVPEDKMFADAWTVDGVQIGIVDVAQVSSDSIAYVVGYINKSTYCAKHGRDDRVPEFSLMSKGLGSNYVTPDVVRYHKADLSRNYLSRDGGNIIAMPRYYRELIFDEDERNVQQSLSEIASGVSNSDKYAEFLKLYGHIEGYSYDRYLESERLGSVTKFYSNQKPRVL